MVETVRLLEEYASWVDIRESEVSFDPGARYALGGRLVRQERQPRSPCPANGCRVNCYR